MKSRYTETVRFGRKRKNQGPKKESTAANLTLMGGIAALGVFFYGTLWGGIPMEKVGQTESDFFGEAVPVMSQSTEETLPADGENMKEFLRKSIRDTSAEPFGYMNGRWNLWEYLGDVMAELLMGG